MNTEILNKYIELINKGYCSDCNELNCLGNFPHKNIAETIEFILKENNELKDKVKELSGWDKNKDTRNSRQRITIKNLLKKNQQLKEQLNKYTDPKDLTLMFMYCDEKAKDKIKCLEQENQQLKEQIEKCQLQNFNLKQDIMIKKISFPNKKIRDKSLIELYNMPSYEDLKRENQQLKEELKQKEDIINKAREKIRLLGKFDGNTCTRGLQMWSADFNKLLEILDIDKGE